MKKYSKVYLSYFGYGETEFIPCEICGARAVDIHHIEGRGKWKDVIENLMGLCRHHHTEAEMERIDIEELHKIHNNFMTFR
jgi:hypothetical protein